MARKAELPLGDEVLLRLGLCYGRLERNAEAIRAWQESLTKFPNSPVAVKAKKRLEQLRKQAARRLERLRKKTAAPTTSPPSP